MDYKAKITHKLKLCCARFHQMLSREHFYGLQKHRDFWKCYSTVISILHGTFEHCMCLMWRMWCLDLYYTLQQHAAARCDEKLDRIHFVGQFALKILYFWLKYDIRSLNVLSNSHQKWTYIWFFTLCMLYLWYVIILKHINKRV